MFTKNLRMLIWLGIIFSIIIIVYIESKLNGTKLQGFALLAGIPIVAVTFSVIGTFMEMAVSIQNIEEQLENMNNFHFKEAINVPDIDVSDINVSDINVPDILPQINGKRCPHCSAEISAAINYCPKCGKEIW